MYKIRGKQRFILGRGEWGMKEQLKLYGFNNLTKSLSFNIYDVCYAKTPREQKDYIAYIDEQYNSKRLTHILTTLDQRCEKECMVV